MARLTEAQQMALDNVGPIRMTLNELSEDFESCEFGWSNGQALCAFELDRFFAVSEATVIEIIPKRRPAKNRVKIGARNPNTLYIDKEVWSLYMRTIKVAEHWIYKGYEYVQIEIIR